MTEQAFSPEEIEAAGRLLGITYTLRERQQMAGNLAGQISLWDTQSGELMRCFSVRPNAASAERVEPSTRSNGIGPRGGYRPESDQPSCVLLSDRRGKRL